MEQDAFTDAHLADGKGGAWHTLPAHDEHLLRRNPVLPSTSKSWRLSCCRFTSHGAALIRLCVDAACYGSCNPLDGGPFSS